jgi:hypothetical protein
MLCVTLCYARLCYAIHYAMLCSMLCYALCCVDDAAVRLSIDGHVTSVAFRLLCQFCFVSRFAGLLVCPIDGHVTDQHWSTFSVDRSRDHPV